MDKLLNSTTSIVAMIVGLAILAVLVSNRGNGLAVIRTAIGGFNTALSTAVNPFSGGGFGASAYGNFGTGMTAN